ncbi:hypothetical protein ACJZ2D_002929 [Fusarium nematophilum]
MRPFVLPAALFAASALAQDVKCADGLYMVVARGTNEDKGSGSIGVVAEDVADRIDGSIILPLDYPATLQDPDYLESESDGVDAMQEALTKYHESCPDGKIAVLGYSQGGQVASDSFCGGAGDGFSDNKALPTDFVKGSVVAIIIFGDPSHVANASYNLGTSNNDGIFARDDIKLCEDEYSDIIRSYCDTGDTYCDQGNDTDVHGEYMTKYGDDAADFVVEQYEKAIEDTASTGTAATASATGTASETAVETASETADETASETTTETAGETGAESATATPTAAPGNAAAGLAPGLLLAAIPLVLAMAELL